MNPESLIEAVFGVFILPIVCLVVNTGSRGGLIILPAEEGSDNLLTSPIETE